MRDGGEKLAGALLAVLFGSRVSEIQRLFPVFADTVGRLRDQRDNLRVIVPIADSVDEMVRARLLADSGVRSVNYNVETHQGVVYLLGVARSQVELDRASQIASLVPDVERVVTYVRIEGQ